MSEDEEQEVEYRISQEFNENLKKDENDCYQSTECSKSQPLTQSKSKKQTQELIKNQTTSRLDCKKISKLKKRKSKEVGRQTLIENNDNGPLDDFRGGVVVGSVSKILELGQASKKRRAYSLQNVELQEQFVDTFYKKLILQDRDSQIAPLQADQMKQFNEKFKAMKIQEPNRRVNPP